MSSREDRELGLTREIPRERQRVLGPGGFDPAADPLAFTANRWPHGYAYACDTTPSSPPTSRKRTGRTWLAVAPSVE
jgi:hypothetical protein